MMGEVLQIGGMLVFAVLLLRLREFFLSFELREWRGVDVQCCKD